MQEKNITKFEPMTTTISRKQTLNNRDRRVYTVHKPVITRYPITYQQAEAIINFSNVVRA